MLVSQRGPGTPAAQPTHSGRGERTAARLAVAGAGYHSGLSRVDKCCVAPEVCAVGMEDSPALAQRECLSPSGNHKFQARTSTECSQNVSASSQTQALS